MSLFNQHKEILDKAIQANKERGFHAQYPEHPKAYGEDGAEKGLEKFNGMLDSNYEGLLQTGEYDHVGEEESPFWQKPLGIKYPAFKTNDLVSNANTAFNSWRNTSIDERAGILLESLERIKDRFFEIAYATMHTSGQSFMMSFQASGPHANDRALEAVAMAYEELNRFSSNVRWVKPMGKFSITLDKDYIPVPKGISLAIGCSTFPIWNTVPGVFASLATGNPVICKPHQGSILPIAIVVEEIQKVLKESGKDINTIQLAADTSENLITKELTENKEVKIIDYTGGSSFGDYVESLAGKTVFTEKAGVNSLILDSVEEIDAVMGNIAFSVSLYSGQMCTAPQNIFIPEGGIRAGDEQLSYEQVIEKLKDHVQGLAGNPKMGAGTLAAIQNETTLERVNSSSSLGGHVVLEPVAVVNEEFEGARTSAPTIMEVNADDSDIYEQELFGPIVLVIKTNDTEHSIQLAKEMASKHGAITCLAYTTDDNVASRITEEMNSVFVPVSFNLTGFIWVNQHAAFSDFHVTGGNPAGNASFTNPDFVGRRFVWVGNRKFVSQE